MYSLFTHCRVEVLVIFCKQFLNTNPLRRLLMKNIIINVVQKYCHRLICLSSV